MQPKAPLSAYNMYFQLERKRILDGTDILHLPITREDLHQICLGHKKTKARRVHRKSHGKIGFGDLARTIAGRWKKLDAPSLQVLRAQAAVEKKEFAMHHKLWRQETRQHKSSCSDAPTRTPTTSFFAPLEGVTPTSAEGGNSVRTPFATRAKREDARASNWSIVTPPSHIQRQDMERIGSTTLQPQEVTILGVELLALEYSNASTHPKVPSVIFTAQNEEYATPNTVLPVEGVTHAAAPYLECNTFPVGLAPAEQAKIENPRGANEEENTMLGGYDDQHSNCLLSSSGSFPFVFVDLLTPIDPDEMEKLFDA
ncbi:hypothetical protein ACA910_008244 [Epithemia clementina (nom. ined.)]